MPLNVILVGAESAAVTVYQNLIGDGHHVAAVLVENPETTGAGLLDRARAAGVPIHPADRVTDPGFADQIRALGVDVLLNVHSLSVVDSEVAGAPSIGSFNLHPGPLPRYSGLNVVTWAIAEGRTSHGVTLHWIDDRIDTGPVVEMVEFPVDDNDTGLSVFRACIARGVEMVRRLMANAETDAGRIAAIPQAGKRRVYRRADRPGDGRVDWSATAGAIHNLARASNFGPFPSPTGHPAARYEGRDVGIVGTAPTGIPADEPAGSVSSLTGGQVAVAAADEWLTVRTVAVDGRSVPARTVLVPGTVVGNG